MKKLIALLFCSIIFFNHAQSNSELLTVKLSAIVQNSPVEVVLNWENDGSSTGYEIYRRESSGSWGSILASISSVESTYTDANVSNGLDYEYKVVKQGTVTGYGYINCAIELSEIENRGVLLFVVEDTYVGNTLFDDAINTTIEDIENDGWFVERISVNQNDDVTSVKSLIVAQYNLNPSNTKGLYLIGHVPVPYSGRINPDGHPEHLGAWPTDAYYGDVNGSWTDFQVNDNTSASDVRNHNVPGDGKFDQSLLPSAVELEVGRIDFKNLPAFSDSEEELLIRYLNKAHAYKVAQFDAEERALIDDNFEAFDEGFASSGYRNFSTMFGANNIVSNLDLRTTTANESYMFTYGCGAGSYTSCSGIGNTNNLSGDSLKVIFSIYFGSYFGDWDNSDNFLRASIAQGQALNTCWAGRPHWQLHKMSLGGTIGESTRTTQNNTTGYFASTEPYFAHWIHIGLLGDPTVRMSYIQPPTNLTVTNINNDASLSWTASPTSVLGYNVYRIDPTIPSYVKVNNTIVTSTIFTDNTLLNGGTIEYVVKAVNLKTTASGSYFNQSLGIRADAVFTAGISENVSSNIEVYPNPFNASLMFKGAIIKCYSLINILGEIIAFGTVVSNEISIPNLDSGQYFLELKEENDNVTRHKLIHQ